jgi:hypothetical protein
MARFPGTEQQHNRDGFQPGQVVRFRRSRANGSRGLADRRGFVTEVRPGAAQVLVAVDGEGTWIESGSLLEEETLPDPELERLRQVFTALGGLRIEFDGREWCIFTEAIPADAVDRVRLLMGERLARFTLAAHGVHELAARLVLAPPG